MGAECVESGEGNPGGRSRRESPFGGGKLSKPVVGSRREQCGARKD